MFERSTGDGLSWQGSSAWHRSEDGEGAAVNPPAAAEKTAETWRIRDIRVFWPSFGPGGSLGSSHQHAAT